jgi:hypothetical protein
MSHTKGPWDVENPMEESLWIVEAGREAYDWTPIATIPIGEPNGGFDAITAEANAALLAAAPDLLEALRSLLAECERNGSFADVGFQHPEVRPFFDAAKAAIAKAENRIP